VVISQIPNKISRHFGQADDSTRISLRLKLARAGFQEAQQIWITAFAVMTMGKAPTYSMDF